MTFNKKNKISPKTIKNKVTDILEDIENNEDIKNNSLIKIKKQLNGILKNYKENGKCSIQSRV